MLKCERLTLRNHVPLGAHRPVPVSGGTWVSGCCCTSTVLMAFLCGIGLIAAILGVATLGDRVLHLNVMFKFGLRAFTVKQL